MYKLSLSDKRNSILIYLMTFLSLGTNGLYAQEKPADYPNLTLEQAMSMGLVNNKKIRLAKINKEVSRSKEIQIFNEQLPEIGIKYGYNAVANLYQYEDHGFKGKPTEYKLDNSMWDVTAEIKAPIFHGGRIQREKRIARMETAVSGIKVEKTEAKVKLDLATNYLELFNLMEHRKIVLDNINEDTYLVNHITSLEKNGVVTHNEVLRTQVQLANDSLKYVTIMNDVDVVKDLIRTNLSLPVGTTVEPSLDNLIDALGYNKTFADILHETHLENEDLRMGEEEVNIKILEKKNQRSMYLPTVDLAGEYFVKYPNYMFFPPTPFAYRFGFIGVNVKLDLTNLYTNHEKVKMTQKKLEWQKLEHHDLEDQVNHQVYQAYTKYNESLTRIRIAEVQLTNATENYRIVKNKYSNQLSLITELIDADVTLLESKSQLITAKIDRQLKYYQLQYLMGKL